MYLRNLKSVLVFLALCLYSQVVFAVEEPELFAEFISGVIHSANGSNGGSVCVLGSDEIVNAMALKNKNLINLEQDSNKYSVCKGVYVAQDKEKFLRNNISKFNRKKIVTISVLENFNENGGMVYVQMGRRNFELTVNSREIKEAGIKLSPATLDLIIN